MILDDFLDNQIKVNISFKLNLIGEEEKEQLIADSFGLGYHTQEFVIYKDFYLDSTKQIYYVTGDSGSGKSLLLKYLKENTYKNDYIDFHEMEVDANEKLYTVCADLHTSLKYLAMLGLGDAFLFLNSYKNLSDGQKSRYRLLKTLLSDKKIIIVDEFLATLDRESASVVSYNIQKVLRREFPNKKLFVATTHRDIESFLRPDVSVFKLYGSEVKVVKNNWDKDNPFIKDCKVVLNTKEGTKLWKDVFAKFHYRSHNIAFMIDIALLYYKDEPVGIIVFKHGACRKQDSARISRVVILPKFRGVGLAHLFLKEACEKFFSSHEQFIAIDTVAIMANFNPFFEKGGFTEVAFKPFRLAEDLRAYLDSKHINFFKFRIDATYAWETLDETIREYLMKIYEKHIHMYRGVTLEQIDVITKENIHKFLSWLEIIYPKKLILKR